MLALAIANKFEENINAEDFEQARRRCGKPLIFEWQLRSGALTSALLMIIIASITINKLDLPIGTLRSVCGYSLSTDLPQLISNTKSAAGWTLFFSLVTLFYQTFAVLQLFFYFKVLYIKIPLGKSFWYLFPLIDIVVNIIWIIGYFPTAIAMGVYSYYWTRPVVEKIIKSDSANQFELSEYGPCFLNYILPIVFTFIFVLGSALHFATTIVFIILAKTRLKWPNYFVPDN